MKTGVVLFVRNDVHSIVHWIAWHLLKGFDRIIICDDFSTDGTWEALEQLAEDHRIHVFQSEKSEPNFQVRQGKAYERALREHDKLDWLAFLDADEFLQLDEGLRVETFLLRFDHADAVAVHWCVYGSSGHVGRPPMPAPEAYLRHSERSWPPNKHVKTFVRPGSINGNYINQHCFAVDPSCYFDSDNQLVVWSKDIGITAAEPSWATAKIMHYQCKSMEDFVERVSLRSDVPYSVANFYALDRNEIMDNATLSETRAYHDAIRSLLATSSCQVSASDLVKRLAKARSSESHKHCGVYELTSFFKRGLHVRDGDVIEQLEGCAALEFLIVFGKGADERAFLIPRDLESMHKADPDVAALCIWPVFATKVQGGVALQGDPGGKYLRAVPQGGHLRFDADEIELWEVFHLEPFGGRVN